MTKRSSKSKGQKKGRTSSSKLSVAGKRHRYIIALTIFSLINVVLWQFPIGRLILYPFTILGTWFHEMGHGIAALLLGGSFHELEIYSNGSGLARYSGELFGGHIGKAIVAAAGPLGPAIAGSLMISSVNSQAKTKIALWILSVVMVISILYFVRSWFGILTIASFAALSIYLNLTATEKAKGYLLLFLGTQACLSTYLSIDYLLSPGAVIGGEAMPSDTMQIANNLFLPYGFWGVAIIFASVLMIGWSVSALYSKK